jgi:hypothetical protein
VIGPSRRGRRSSSRVAILLGGPLNVVDYRREMRSSIALRIDRTQVQADFSARDQTRVTRFDDGFPDACGERPSSLAAARPSAGGNSK